MVLFVNGDDMGIFTKKRSYISTSLTRLKCSFSLGTPGGTRTPNPQNRNLMRYPLRYWRIAILTCQVIIAGETGIVKENFDEFQKKFLGRNFGKKTEGDLLPAGFRDRVNW